MRKDYMVDLITTDGDELDYGTLQAETARDAAGKAWGDLECRHTETIFVAGLDHDERAVYQPERVGHKTYLNQVG